MINYNSQRGGKIRVLFAKNPPDAFTDCIHFPTMQPTMECPFPGWCVEILYHLAQYLHFTIEPVIMNARVGEVNWGTYTNGSWNGVLGYIENGTVDTACLFYQRTGLRAKHFSFTYPIINTKPAYAVHARPEDISSTMWNAFTPYAKSTWMAMVIIWLIQTAYCIFVTKVEVRMQRRSEYRPYQIMWKFLRLQLYQPDRFDYVTIAGNFAVLVFTIMQCRLLLDMYQTLLLSSLLQPSVADPFTNARDMIKMIASQRYHLITNYIGNWYFEELRNSNVSHYKSLRGATANNPVHVANSVTSALDKVEAGGYIYPIQQDSLAMQMAKRRCNLVFVTEGLPEMSSHFIFQHVLRNNRTQYFLDALNDAIIMNMDFIRRTFAKYFQEGFKTFDELTPCVQGSETARLSLINNEYSKQTLKLKPLGIVSMFGVLFVMIIGLILSLTAFAMEVYYTWQRKMFQLRLRARRQLVEPIHLMALARMFGGGELQRRIDEQMNRPTIPEVQAHFGELYM
ncbi:glutamate receptor U1 [Ditylenchus destructor]|uniref:Glutamate receptor U1 n=1 Tax=Ditylenchus destructor TaxID=166010 RepID=A0AAD4MV50_9BILA|nr:glutamate receptor U1 [Ditylenchus destructor]